MSPRGAPAAALRRLTLALILVLALGIVIGAGVYLKHTQDAAEAKVHREFAALGRLTANLTGDTLKASDPAFRELADGLFAGSAKEVAAENKADQAAQAGVYAFYVAAADGTVLAANPPALRAEAAEFTRTPAFDVALESKILTMADASVQADKLSIQAQLPYSTKEGRRLLVAFFPIEQASTFVKAYVTSALGATGGRAYVLDGQNQVIASTGADTVGQPLGDQTLNKAVQKAGTGRLGGDYYVTTPVPAANWRIIFVTSEAALMAPIQSSTRIAWQLFGAFVVAILLLLIIGAMSLLGSARLAHARLHDTLTGLPNRALFLDRTTQAINERRQHGPIAALFIDLDGFKPINDTYGHAIGDALLKSVSERLLESMRPGDYVSRFGGDEFLVLCQNLRHPPDAFAIAERIQTYIAEPFEIGGKSLSIGTSIGVALLDDHADHAEALIHNADLAMYRAKQTGRGRIEQFTPDMAATA